MVRLLLCFGVIYLALLLVFSIPFFQIPLPVTVAIFVILLIFGMAIYGSMAAGKKLNAYVIKSRYHAISEEDRKKIFQITCLRMLPVYLCFVVVSLFPLIQWEVWAIVCLPCVVITYLAASVVYRYYRMLTGYKWRFWVFQGAVFVAVQLVCQSIIHLFF